MFSLFKKWSKVSESETPNLELVLQKLVTKFDVNLDTISKVTTDNNKQRLVTFTLETLDNHKITVELYSGDDARKYPEDVTLTIDDWEAIEVPSHRVSYYVSAYGVAVKDKYTIMSVAKQLQAAFKQETVTFVEANDVELTRGMIVPGIVHVIDKQTKSILATVVIVHKVIKVKLPQLDDYITLGSVKVDPDHVQDFIETFIL